MKNIFHKVLELIGVVVVLILLLVTSKEINEYSVEKYQEQFERDENGVIIGLDGFNLIGGNNEAVVLIHGLTDSPNNMRQFAEFFNFRGYSVYVPLLPGHGTYVQDLNEKKYNDWYDKAEETLKNVKENKVYLVGYSLGGLLSLDLASKNQVDGVITINAPIRIKNRYTPFIPFVKLAEEYHIKNKERMQEIIESGLTIPYNAMPLNSVLELFEGINNLEMGDIDEPIFIIQGIDDDVVDRDSAIVIYDQVSSEKKELLFLEDSTHEIIRNEEEDYDKILDFISSS